MRHLLLKPSFAIIKPILDDFVIWAIGRHDFALLLMCIFNIAPPAIYRPISSTSVGVMRVMLHSCQASVQFGTRGQMGTMVGAYLSYGCYVFVWTRITEARHSFDPAADSHRARTARWSCVRKKKLPFFKKKKKTFLHLLITTWTMKTHIVLWDCDLCWN